MAPSLLLQVARRAGRYVRRRLTSADRDDDCRSAWEARWSDPHFTAPWLGRGVSPEVEEAVAEGWFPEGSAALDVGCGEGVVAAWLAERSFRAVGIDIASSAVDRARARYPETPGQLEFHAVDVCRASPPPWKYRALVDRGCYHQIAPDCRRAYFRNLARASADDARMLLFVKAFREGQPLGDQRERERVVGTVQEGLGEQFSIVSCEPTWLDPLDGRDPKRAMPGLVFRLMRTAPSGGASHAG